MTPDQLTDAEILGRRYPLRRAVSEVGNQRMRAIESAQASWSNFKDTPRKLSLQLSRSLAESRRDRAKARYDAVAHLPDGSFLKQRRLAKLRKAERKFNQRESAFNAHTQRMANRREAVNRNYNKRREETLKNLADRRKQAEARKALRHELKNQGASFLEVRAILQEIPAEQKARVGHLAIESALRQKGVEKYASAAEESLARESTLSDNLARTVSEASNAEKRISGASESLRDLQSKLPEASERVAELTKQADLTPEDSPNRLAIMAELQEAQNILDDYNRRTTQLEAVIASDQRVITEADKRRNELEAQLTKQHQTTEDLTSKTRESQQSAQARADQLRETSQNTLNGIEQ